MSTGRTRRTKRHTLVVQCASEYANSGAVVTEPNLLDIHTFLVESASEETRQQYAEEYDTEVTLWESRQRYFLYHVVMCVDAIGKSNQIRQHTANTIDHIKTMFDEQLQQAHNKHQEVVDQDSTSEEKEDSLHTEDFTQFVALHQAEYTHILVDRLGIFYQDACTIVRGWTLSYFV